MSTSKGRGVSFADMTDYAPASLLRYLLVKTRPHAVIDFDPVGTNKIILLYESYDRTERIYYNKEHIPNEKEAQHEKRVYELSHVDPIKKTIPTQIPFTYAAALVQIAGDVKPAMEALLRTGHVPDSISAGEKKYIVERLAYAKRWVDEFAPDDYKFIVSKSVSKKTRAKIRNDEVSALLMFRDKLLKRREYTESECMEQIKEVVNESGIAPRQFYRAAYLALLNKEHGPKLTSLIKMIGQKETALILGSLEK